MRHNRFFEILPGMFAWGTIFLMFLLSWQLPTAVAYFIILFDTYWLLKSIYLSLHLRSTFKQMKANLKIDWLKKLEETDLWRDMYHLVILPMHSEPWEVVRESFQSLVQSDYPKDKLIVVLALEEQGGAQAIEVGERIRKEFEQTFFKFLVTVHPQNLLGEIPGKGSNESWAGKEIKRIIIDPLKIPYDRILVSVFDIDTQVPAGYFARLTHAFITSPRPLRSIYQPVPMFTNNIYQAPALARVIAFSTTFWQMMQQARPERLTSFSSQSISFQALVDIGFWHRNVVSEDSRIFWQCLLHYHGDFNVHPLLYPVSLDANAAPTFWGTLKNLYKQQRRWAWGAENMPYILEGFQKDRVIPRRTKWYWTLIGLEGYWSWATNSLMIFALGWLPVLIGGRDFKHMLLAYSLPKVTRYIIGLSMIGIATSAIMGIALLPPKPKGMTNLHFPIYFFQWILLPITLIIFGAFPAIEAQTRLMLGGKYRLGFWVTPKGRNTKQIDNKQLATEN